MITTRQGPLLQGEFRQRLIDGAYAIRAAGILSARQGLRYRPTPPAIVISAAALRAAASSR